MPNAFMWAQNTQQTVDMKLKTRKRLTSNPISIFAITDVGSQVLSTPLGPILSKFTCD